LKLSTRSRYGLRFMYELALHFGEGVILLKQIAKTQNISEKYLSNLAIPLKGAGLITSIRGSHGGYELTKHPSQITVKEMYEILEGDSIILDCIEKGYNCDMNEVCPTRDMWISLQKQIENFMEHTTLQDLVNRYEEKKNAKEFVYMI
jgi:Rrf2 family protein